MNSFFQSVSWFLGLSLDVRSAASCSPDAMNVSLSSLLTSLERHATSELYLDFLSVKWRKISTQGLLWEYEHREGGGSSSWLYDLPEVIFTHFLYTVCIFLIASHLKFERNPSALLPQGAVVCCTLIPWGSLAFTTYGFPLLKLKHVRQQSVTTAKVSAKLILPLGNGKKSHLQGYVVVMQS